MLKERTVLQSEEAFASTFQALERQLSSDVDVKLFHLRVLNEKYRNEDEERFGYVYHNLREQLNEFLKNWFPFSSEELYHLGVKNRNVFEMMKLSKNAKGMYVAILKNVKDPKVKEKVKRLIEQGVDDLVILYLLMFLLKDMAATGTLNEGNWSVIEKVLRWLEKKCGNKVLRRAAQLRYLHFLRTQFARFTDVSGFVMKALSALFLNNAKGGLKC
jgi:hypothetical protein